MEVNRSYYHQSNLCFLKRARKQQQLLFVLAAFLSALKLGRLTNGGLPETMTRLGMSSGKWLWASSYFLLFQHPKPHTGSKSKGLSKGIRNLLSSNRICDNSTKRDAGLLSQFYFIRIGLLQRFGTSVMPRAALRSSNLATSTNCLQSYHLSTRQRPEIAPFLGDEITARCCHFLWHKMVYIGFDGENMTGSYLYETIRIQMIQVSYTRKMPSFLSIRKRQKNAYCLDIVCCIARGQYLYILKTP